MNEALDPLGLVGATVAEKYAVERVVGQGGFATVYRATHTLWKRPVALKVFTALGEVDPSQRQKLLDDFIQEGALLADLSERTTAICQARDVGMLVGQKGENVPYMVLEWLDGKPLEDLLAAERAGGAPLRSLEQAVRLLDPIAEALALAHKKGIAHRDVKPANVFVLAEPADATGRLEVKLLDFGIAKVVQDAQKMGFGKTAGHITSFTPLYGAPEQFNRSYGATGPWTDVFALALVVAEVVSGREPMGGDNLVQLAYAAADPQKRPTPRALGIPTSDEVEGVFLRAVAIRPEERFQTVGEFWNALRAAAGGDPLSSRGSLRAGTPAAQAFATSETVLRHPGPAGAGGTLLVSQTGPHGPSSAPPSGFGPPSAASTHLSSTGRGPDPNAATALPSAALPPAGSARGSSALPIAVVAGIALLAFGGIGAYFGLRGRTASLPPPSASAASASVTSQTSAVAVTPASASTAAPSCPAGMVAVPGGEFFMGSDEKDALPFEKPPHKVKLSPYCLDEHEVTVADFKACSDAGGCRRAGKENVWTGIKPAQRKIYDPLCNINDAAKKGNHPINCVDWEQAREYCTYRGARLPTEAEWEFGARGSDSRIYPWGDEAPSGHLLNACGRECMAWARTHSDPDGNPTMMYDEDDGFPNTAPVGSFPKGKSRWGAVDMVGNVWEWVSDNYADYDPASKDTMAMDPQGPASGTDRVIRGGAWNGSEQSWVRPSYRFHAAPTMRSYGFGFRCAKGVGGPTDGGASPAR